MQETVALQRQALVQHSTGSGASGGGQSELTASVFPETLLLGTRRNRERPSNEGKLKARGASLQRLTPHVFDFHLWIQSLGWGSDTETSICPLTTDRLV